MRGAQSISTRRAYGVQRVCRVWHCARSMYRPRVLGQWFDGIRIYAAASSPPRSRRTRAGLR